MNLRARQAIVQPIAQHLTNATLNNTISGSSFSNLPTLHAYTLVLMSREEEEREEEEGGERIVYEEQVVKFQTLQLSTLICARV